MSHQELVTLLVNGGTLTMLGLGSFGVALSTWRWMSTGNPQWLGVDMLLCGGVVHRLGVLLGRNGVIKWGTQFGLFDLVAIILAIGGASILTWYLAEMLNRKRALIVTFTVIAASILFGATMVGVLK